MAYSSHGGSCCGISHLFGLDRMPLDDFDEQVNTHFAAPMAGGGVNDSRILEVVLSSRQIVTPPPPGDTRFHESVRAAGGWLPILAARGFQLAESWHNSNSGNRCYRFVKIGTSRAGFGFVDPPEAWAGGRLTLSPPPVVETVVRPPVYAVGDYVRGVTIHRGHVGRVTEVRPDNTLSVQWEIGATNLSPRVRLETIEKVLVVEANGSWNQPGVFPPPARVDPLLPIEVVNNRGIPSPAVIVDTRGIAERDQVTVRAAQHLTTAGNRDLNTPYNYDLSTGAWSGMHGENIARIRNTIPPVVVRPPQATEPVVRHTEYFANLRNVGPRGPFETMEALRESYPRVRSFVTRRILSDGSIQEETADLPRDAAG